MTGRSHYVWGVELAVAELQEPFGIGTDLSPLVISLEGVRAVCVFNARSDKTTLSGPFELKREFAAVRMLARCTDLTATSITSVLGITAATPPSLAPITARARRAITRVGLFAISIIITTTTRQ
jgi:hypothetical protein